jgi:hypothetical protein
MTAIYRSILSVEKVYLLLYEVAVKTVGCKLKLKWLDSFFSSFVPNLIKISLSRVVDLRHVKERNRA